MTDHDEHQGTLDEILRQRKRRKLRNVAIGLVVLLGAIGVALWTQRASEPPPEPVAAPAPTPAPVVARRPPPPPPPERKPEPAPAAPKPPEPDPLPQLDESDSFVRDVVSVLSQRPEFATWLASDELIRRFVASVDAVAEGRAPREQLDAMWPEERFRTVGEDDLLGIDPTSYARYDMLTEVIVGIDAKAAARAYREAEPLIDEAYRDLGYPDRPFEDALRRALVELLSTPVVVGDPLLEQRVISYGYADPELEGLSRAQKQLLRLGPTNAPRVQRKLRELAAAIGVPESELPRTPIHKVRAPFKVPAAPEG